MCTYRKVGTFTRITGFGRRSKVAAKVGGNVASYVCTPDGKVVHAIPGNVGGPILAKEVSWAQELYATTQIISRGEPSSRAALLRAAHLDRARTPNAQLSTLRGQMATVTPEAHVQTLGMIMTADVKPARDNRSERLSRTIRTRIRALAHVRGRFRSGLVLLQSPLSSVFPYLAQHAGSDLSTVYQHVWTKIVGEAISDAPVRTVQSRGGCRGR